MMPFILTATKDNGHNADLERLWKFASQNLLVYWSVYDSGKILKEILVLVHLSCIKSYSLPLINYTD